MLTPEEKFAVMQTRINKKEQAIKEQLTETPVFNASGEKYLRSVIHLTDGKADVYAFLEAFGVTCPARGHAIKKLIMAGLRGKAGVLQDLHEARDALDRAIQMQETRERIAEYNVKIMAAKNGIDLPVKKSVEEWAEEWERKGVVPHPSGVYMTPEEQQVYQSTTPVEDGKL
jgi:hypothetical protein